MNRNRNATKKKIPKRKRKKKINKTGITHEAI